MENVYVLIDDNLEDSIVNTSVYSTYEKAVNGAKETLEEIGDQYERVEEYDHGWLLLDGDTTNRAIDIQSTILEQKKKLYITEEIKMSKSIWTKTQKALFNWLVRWEVSGDEELATKIVNAGYLGYEYGAIGCEEVDREQYENDSDYRSFIDSQSGNWRNDEDLPGSKWWLIGAQY